MRLELIENDVDLVDQIKSLSVVSSHNCVQLCIHSHIDFVVAATFIELRYIFGIHSKFCDNF